MMTREGDATDTRFTPHCWKTGARLLDSFEKQSECQPCETDQSCSNHLELQVSASGGTEDVGNLLENHFSAGDASLEEKERALLAEAAPREKNLLLHSPDGREAESSEKTATGASTAAPSPGSDPEASLSNASASAPPGDPVELPGANSLTPEGEGGTGEEGRPELSLREGPEEEAEGQAGSGVVPEEAKDVLGENPAQGAAVGTAEPEGTGAFPVEVETAGKGIPGPDQGPERPVGVMDVDTKAREGPEDQGEPSPALETGGAQEDHPPESQVSGTLEEDLKAASSEEDGGGLSRGEEGGDPSQEESEEDNGHGASSEEAGDTSEEAGEHQEAAGTPSPGDKGAQLSFKEPNPGPEGDKVPEAEAEEPVEGPQGRGPQNSFSTWAAAFFLEVLYVVGQAGTGWSGRAPASLGLRGGGPVQGIRPRGWLQTAHEPLLPTLEGLSDRPHHGGPREA